MSASWPPAGLSDFAQSLPFEHLLRKRLPNEAMARWHAEADAWRHAPACRVGILLAPCDDLEQLRQTLACWQLQTWPDLAFILIDEPAGAWQSMGEAYDDRLVVTVERDVGEALSGLGVDWVVPAMGGDLLHPSLAGIVARHARGGARAVAWDWFKARRHRNAVTLVSRQRGPWRDAVAERAEDLRSRAFAIPASHWFGHPVRAAWSTRMGHDVESDAVGLHHEPLSILFDEPRTSGPQGVALSKCWRTPFAPDIDSLEPVRDADRFSVIVLYRDKPELTIRALESVCRQRIPGQLQLVLVDNQSKPATKVAVRQFLDGLPAHVEHSVVDYDAPFNHSRQSNCGAAVAVGEVLVFLNNDVELLDVDALRHLGRWALVPRVASVGCRVVDAQGRTVGGGFRARRQPGAEFNSPVEEASGTLAERSRCTVGNTFACAAVSAQAFAALGGLDEIDFPIGYNDVDFCLRATSLGWIHVNLASVRVMHAVGASRARTDEIAQKLSLRCAHPWLAVRALQEIDSESLEIPETMLAPLPKPPASLGALL